MASANVAMPRTGRASSAVAWIALCIAVLCGAGALAGGPGYRLGLWTFGTGIQIVRWSATVALAAAVLAVLAISWPARKRAPHTRAIGLLALAFATTTAAPPLYLYWRATQLPLIHDISTDTEDPPRFVAILPLRQGANPVDYGAAVAAQQKRAYPDIEAARLAIPPAQALARCEAVARALGWEIVAIDPAAGRIEATATTPLFGFKDDVVIRVTPRDRGSRVDVRSTSRVGVSDLGTNAERVRAFMGRLQQQP